MQDKLSGLEKIQRDYDADRKVVGDFLYDSRQKLGLSIEDSAGITQLPEILIEMAEQGMNVPHYVRDILATFYNHTSAYLEISSQKAEKKQ